MIARNTGKSISIGKCDFNSMVIEDIEIPDGAVIFTSYSIHYTQSLNERIVDYLFQFDPRAVILFEPCYEYYDKNTLHGMMCKHYMKINGYTENIASSIELGCKNLGIEFKSNKNIFGSNPFLPISIIECIPK